MLDFNHFWKADETPSINYVLLESFFKGIDGYKYNFEKPPTAKEGEEFCGEHALKLINSEKKKMVRLTNKEYQYILNQRNCHICKK